MLKGFLMGAGISSESGHVISETLPVVDESRQDASRHERRLHHVLSQIEESLRGLRFGQVTITVQDGVVVQIDRLERTRVQRTVE
jgi:hypothetical protein